jgi:hypothetical protein
MAGNKMFTTPKNKKAPFVFNEQGFNYTAVGVAGFEPAASTSQMWRDTGLRYTPNWDCKGKL